MVAAASDITGMSQRGRELLGSLRKTLELLAEHEKASPEEVNQIVEHLIAHCRAWKPMLLAGQPVSIDPVASIERELGDGARYLLGREAGCTVLTLVDADGERATVALPAVMVVRMRSDLAAVGQ
jgi:hypothetical protein